MEESASITLDVVEVTVRDGVLRGRRENGLTVLSGVRYATADRFGPPVPEAPWTGVRDALQTRGVCPQPTNHTSSILDPPPDLPQSEDCLEVTVVTPAADDAGRPVVVFLHGGSYRTGASAWPRYRGDRLAREGDVVFVGVSSRLGPLGFLRLPGVSTGDQGLLDIVEALRWVRANAAYLGGDSDNVTVIGHSSGAHALVCLLGSDDVPIRRAIVQSPPLGLGLGDAKKAGRIAEKFRAALGVDPLSATAEEIVAAHVQAERGPAPAFAPVIDVVAWRKRLRERASELEVVVGTTHHEAAYFLSTHPIERRVPVLGKAIERLVIRIGTIVVFTRPAARFARELERAGGTVRRYRLVPGAFTFAYGVSHCIDLPMLYGDEAVWTAAPIVSGRTWAQLEADGRLMREAWIAYARHGAAAWTSSAFEIGSTAAG
jgi:para-nitrobenzyl esterase